MCKMDVASGDGIKRCFCNQGLTWYPITGTCALIKTGCEADGSCKSADITPLIAVISAGSASSNIISSYDLRSPIPHCLIFSSSISVSSDSVIATVDVSASTGDAYIATASGEIFKSDLFGNLSNLVHDGKGITGMSFVNNGYLLVVGPTGMFKVDAEDGVVKQVLTSFELNMEKVRMRKDGAVVTGGKTYQLKSLLLFTLCLQPHLVGFIYIQVRFIQC